MNGRVWGYLLLICLATKLSGCNFQTRETETDCKRAIALVRYTWQVAYYRDRTQPNPEPIRIQDFATTSLVTINGEKPEGANLRADHDLVWHPKVPPSPTARDIEAARQVGEQFNPPQLKRRIRYSLQCSAGEFAINRSWYREFTPLFRQGRSIKALYAGGRVSKAFLPFGGILRLKEPLEITTIDALTGMGSTPLDSSLTSESPGGNRIPHEVYVDPQRGSDRATGTADQPFETITRAIQEAKYGTVIRLNPGLYNSATGEEFPLTLKPGLALKAVQGPQGAEVRIVGSGRFLSRTWAGQNVTIVAEKDSRITGLTITNPNTRGTGIWIESGSPTIDSNRFLNCKREGIFVSGNANPLILRNVFEKNGGNGLSFTRDSKGLMQGNQIRASGFGVAIGDRAAPRLFKNEVVQNLDGVVINGEAQPKLESNTIENNRRDGLVVTNQAKPQLQANLFRGNGQYDIHNATGKGLPKPQNVAGLKVKGL